MNLPDEHFAVVKIRIRRGWRNAVGRFLIKLGARVMDGAAQSETITVEGKYP